MRKWQTDRRVLVGILSAVAIASACMVYTLVVSLRANESAAAATYQAPPAPHLACGNAPRRIRVGISDLDYPPFYFEQNGQLQGAAFEIASAVAGAKSYSLQINRYPWARIQYYLRTGEIEMMILYFKTPERAKDVIYAEIAHIFEASVLFVPKQSTVNFSGDLRNLKAYRFANVRGYSHGREYEQADYLQKQQVNNEEQLIRVLVYGRADIAVGNQQAIAMSAARIGLDQQIRFLEPPVAVEPNYFAFSKACPDAAVLARDFSAGLRAFMQTPAYAEILVKYGFDATPPTRGN